MTPGSGTRHFPSLTQVDAFAERPFEGNPAAVCLLADPGDDEWMQRVADEMNLSETAFLWPQSGPAYGLRWFTPAAEVDLCGHATLASAHVLWERGAVSGATTLRFDTRSGPLTARQEAGLIEIDSPAVLDREVVAPPRDLVEALGVAPRYVGRNRMDYLVVLDAEEVVRRLRPDLVRLAQVETRGVIVTAQSTDSRFDFVSRFFAPRVGIDEDPVTGSAHCCLGPYWRRILGRDEFTAYQASPRGGVVRVRVAGDRVALAGTAVTVFSAELRC